MAKIVWPSREDKTKHYSSLIKHKFPLLTKCFGFIDGLNLPVMVADDDE
jgi:preprotein translocase subunit SecE